MCWERLLKLSRVTAWLFLSSVTHIHTTKLTDSSCLPLFALGTEPPEGEEEPVFTREIKFLKEVVVAKDPPVVHVYDVVEHGRRFYRTLAFSSDASLSLASMPPLGVSQSLNDSVIQ